MLLKLYEKVSFLMFEAFKYTITNAKEKMSDMYIVRSEKWLFWSCSASINKFMDCL